MLKRLIAVLLWLDILFYDLFHWYYSLNDLLNIHWFLNIDRLNFDLVLCLLLAADLDLKLVKLVVEANDFPSAG